jgi:hypothetical protein
MKPRAMACMLLFVSLSLASIPWRVSSSEISTGELPNQTTDVTAHPERTLFEGEINQDTEWVGEILVTGPVTVQAGATLTIHPGTRVLFQHYRGYREPWKRLIMLVRGKIHAEGTPDAPIYFTSDAPDPQNGDWGMLRIVSPREQSVFKHVVFEFAQHGLNVWAASPEISYSVFRWNNWEGVYFESYSKPVLDHCRIYENGYNGLAAEQNNEIYMDLCEVWRNGTSGVHIDNSNALITQSRIHHNNGHGLSVDNGSSLRAYGDAIFNNSACGIGFGEGTNMVEVSNLDIHDNGGGGDICGPVTNVSTALHAPFEIGFDFQPDMSRALGYIPGDPLLDGFMYVYPDDETRRITSKLGAGLGLTWSVAWHEGYLWTATLWNHVYRLDPETGAVLEDFSILGSPVWGTPSQPWGMDFDDQGYLWIVDFAERKLFKVNPETHSVVFSFATPFALEGGCKGLAWDGKQLNVMGWISPVLYQMDKTGQLTRSIQLDSGGGGGLAWDGEYFWVPGRGVILKYDRQGRQTGWIYAASEGTWDMAWAEGALWATQRTNENWLDDKLFRLEVLDDHHQQLWLPVLFKR